MKEPPFDLMIEELERAKRIWSNGAHAAAKAALENHFGKHVKIDWPGLEMLATFLANLSDDPFDEVLRRKYTADAYRVLEFFKDKTVKRLRLE